jgi:hypothetical protein
VHRRTGIYSADFLLLPKAVIETRWKDSIFNKVKKDQVTFKVQLLQEEIIRGIYQSRNS